MRETARQAEQLLHRHGVRLTLGAEPTCVPDHPRGLEWTVAADGPSKRVYARRLARALLAEALPGGVVLLSPGKRYPGEINPRWSLHLIGRRDGRPLLRRRPGRRRATPAQVAAFFPRLLEQLRLEAAPQVLRESRGAERVRVLPLDHRRGGWYAPAWSWPATARLLAADGPAGLRLPWSEARGRGPQRALTVQCRDGCLEIFLPPLRQEAWTELLEAVVGALPPGCAAEFSGYLPEDEAGRWHHLEVSIDPGVLEINFPPSASWREYDGWLRALDRAQRRAGLRPWKIGPDGNARGTDGGHHLLLGGPRREDHPFFSRPGWLASILRFWQHHPSLAYLFTGSYVGSASQAPRADESGKSSHDLEMTYTWLESLPAGRDHRQAMADALIHLHADASGNSHRTEISFDKFWNVQFYGGARGLVEFRAIESLPRSAWSSAVALLWYALAAHLLARPFRAAVRDFGASLHDRYFLPSWLWHDFREVLQELAAGGLPLGEKVFRSIWEWRFPVLLAAPDGLVVRRALEAWPLLCETPLEGGTTSRFVDSSIERLEISVPAGWHRRARLFVNGRPLKLRARPDGSAVAGVSYRATARYPSLHPGIPVQMPLVLSVQDGAETRHYVQREKDRRFRPAPCRFSPPERGAACRTPGPEGWTFDLRLS
jgi:uncharacterized protein (DUF2126 family)